MERGGEGGRKKKRKEAGDRRKEGRKKEVHRGRKERKADLKNKERDNKFFTGKIILCSWAVREFPRGRNGKA